LQIGFVDFMSLNCTVKSS